MLNVRNLDGVSGARVSAARRVPARSLPPAYPNRLCTLKALPPGGSMQGTQRGAPLVSRDKALRHNRSSNGVSRFVELISEITDPLTTRMSLASSPSMIAVTVLDILLSISRCRDTRPTLLVLASLNPRFSKLPVVFWD